MLIPRDQLCALIPHGSGMCMLDEVLAWDETTIRCRTSTHVDPGNPLRTSSGLSSLQAVEYGAQAMAVHGGLLAREREQSLNTAYLAALRQVVLNVDWLHDRPAPLIVEAQRLMAAGNSMIYDFSVLSDGDVLVQGRATVMGSSRRLMV